MKLTTNYAELNLKKNHIWYINPAYNYEHKVKVIINFSNCKSINLKPILVNKNTNIVYLSLTDIDSNIFYKYKALNLKVEINIGNFKENYYFDIIRTIEKINLNSSFLYKVIYIDYLSIDWNNPGNTIKQAVDAGFNIINLAFYIQNGPADMAFAWSNLDQSTQIEISNYAHSKGAKILVSAGGATDNTMYDKDPFQYAMTVCKWALDNNLDGVDYDLEDIQPGFLISNKNTQDTYNWFKILNETSRQILGSNRIISHAPQAPYLAQPGQLGTWPGIDGGYVKVFNDVKNTAKIDFFNIQFYNQGNDNYNTYEKIFINSGINFPYSSIYEISNQNDLINGLPIDKLVYGTYLQSNDGSGFHDPTLIKQYMEQANKDLNWNSGTMLWLWNTTGNPTAITWYNTIYN